MNQLCPACQNKRLHTDEERRFYHPDSGHGYLKEIGWTKPTLSPQYEKEGFLPHGF